jgi:hypothetical protein
MSIPTSYSASSGASATGGKIGDTTAGGGFGNVSFGGSGIDLPTIAVIGGLAIVALYLFNKRR